MKIWVGQVFGIDSDLEVPAYSEANEHVPDFDNDYLFDRETTLAILAVLPELTPELEKPLVSVAAPTPSRIELSLEKSRTVFWGDASKSVRKADLLVVDGRGRYPGDLLGGPGAACLAREPVAEATVPQRLPWPLPLASGQQQLLPPH